MGFTFFSPTVTVNYRYSLFQSSSHQSIDENLLFSKLHNRGSPLINKGFSHIYCNKSQKTSVRKYGRYKTWLKETCTTSDSHSKNRRPVGTDPVPGLTVILAALSRPHL